MHFSTSDIGRSIINGTLDFPPDKKLPGTSEFCPHFIVGDAAFPGLPNLIRPFPDRGLDDRELVFNYRLSRARRCVENLFGIMASRFRIFGRAIQGTPDKVLAIVKACICLHNFIMGKKERRFYCPRGYADQEKENGKLNLTLTL